MNGITKLVKEFGKKVAFSYFKLGKPQYPYNVEPIELATIIIELERLKDTKGNIAEIGVARGLTTRFICQHLTSEKIDNNVIYYAIDTFESFTKDDLKYEIEHRGKNLVDLKGFEYNNYDVWCGNFEEYSFLKAIKSDCSLVNYDEIGPLKLTFLDVDLYIPTKKTLSKVFKATVGGGVILIDNVEDNSTYDGAYQAYIEFCSEMNLPVTMIGNKCGIIFKK